MIRLGLRLSIGAGRAGLIRTVLMSSGAALGVLIMLACLAGMSVAGAQQRRAEARSPVFGAEEAGDRPVAAFRLAEINEVIGDRPLRRVAVGGATAGSPRPPGLAGFPGPGEVVVSPALSALIRTDPRAAERFPQRIVGTIGRHGLVAPDELRAYVGVEADDPHLMAADRRVRSFNGRLHYADGGQLSTDPEVYAASRALALSAAAFILLPLGVFLAACARLSASIRDRRIAALRLLGISAGQAARVNAVETAAVAAAGALLGVLLFAVLAPLSEGLRIGRLQWYAADIDLPAGWVAAVLALVVGHAVVVGVLATGAARTRPLAVRRDAPARRPSPWRAAPLAVALCAALLAGHGTALQPPTRAVLLGLAMTMAGLGLPPVVPLLGYAAAGVVARIRRSPVWLTLAGARLRHASGGAARLAAALTVAIYLAGLCALGTVVAADIQAVPVPEDWNNELSYQLQNPEPGLVARLREVPGIQVMDVASLAATTDGGRSSIVVADCADFTEMYQLAAGESCADAGTYRLDFTRLHDADGPPAGTLAVTGDGLRITVPAQTLHPVRQRHSTGATGGLLLTRTAPALSGRAPGGDTPSVVDVIAADRVAADRAARLVARSAPAGSLEGDAGFRAGLDEDLVATLLMVAMMAGFVLGVGAFVVAVAGRAIDSRRDNAPLAMLGVRPALLALTEAASAAVPLLLGVLLAGLCVVVMAVSVARVLGTGIADGLRPIAAVGWLGAGAVLIALIVIGALARLTQRIGPEHLRRP